MPKLTPPPRKDDPRFDDWLREMYARLIAVTGEASEPAPVVLTAAQANDLTDGGESTAHYHAADRSRANHTGTQSASTINDFTPSVLALISTTGGHPALSGLSWTSSGHVGTATRVAGFGASGEAVLLTRTGSGTEVVMSASPTVTGTLTAAAITTSGDVGVGTTPSRRLHAYTASGHYTQRLESGTTDIYNEFLTTSGSAEFGIYQDSMYFQALDSLAGGVRFYSSTSLLAMQLLPAGDVVVGSASPVRRDVDNSLLTLQGGASAADGGQVLLYGDDHATNPGEFHLKAINSTGYTLTGIPGSGFLTWDGLEFQMTAGAFRGKDGSNTSPTYSWASPSDNTGMYLSNTDEISFATNGGQRLKIGATGTVTAKGQLLTDAGSGGGIGYASGAGGTQTQGTSKSTGVTLDTPVGQITMNNASLGAGTKVSFVVTCGSCATTDIPVVAVDSGGTANAYRADVTAVGAGSFTITVENITGGSLSESPVISYAIIKGVTS